MQRQLTSTFVPLREETITHIRQKDRELKFSELRYRRLFETAQDGILILDTSSGKITDANPFLKNLLGYSDAELLGKQLWKIGVFKDIVDSKQAFRELQNKGYLRYKDLPLLTKDGKPIDVELISNTYMVASQKVFQCNIRDITERRKIEEAIKSKTEDLERMSKSQEDIKKAMLNVMEDLENAKILIEIEKVKDEAMLESIGEGLIAIDNYRKILIMNRAAEDMLGWKMKDMIGHTIVDLPLADEEGRIVELDKRPTSIVLETGETITSTYYFVRKDKKRFPIALTVTPIKLGGKIIGAVDIFRDITRELEIDKEKSEFVSLASHQLRTPLGIMKWYLEALENENYITKAPATIRKYFDEIYKSNERVLSVVSDLLSVSRIDQGLIKNDPVLTDLSQIVTGVVAQMKIVAKKKKVALHLTVHDKNIPRVTIDALRFHEVIENLIANAVAYTDAFGSITVTVKKIHNAIFISVKDTGIGISEADQKKLFTKFFRAEKAIRHNPEGSGLGLYVVKSYVEGWGGKISAKSTYGKDTTFTIRLPFSKNSSRGGRRSQ